MQIPVISSVKNGFISWVIFFLTVGILSVGYALINNVWTNPSALEVSAGSWLTATAWNALLANFNNLDVKVWNATPKAWVFFSNTGAIVSSYNISSVSKAATGRYTVTFSTPMPSIKYWITFGGINTGAGDGGWASIDNMSGGKSTTNCKIVTYNSVWSYQDWPEAYIIFWGP